jgi:hypothetical protein
MDASIRSGRGRALTHLRPGRSRERALRTEHQKLNTENWTHFQCPAYDGVMTREQALAVLFAVYDLAAADMPADAGRLAERVGFSKVAVAEVLLHLERRGLVDAGKVRLTIRGLAIAHALTEHARRNQVGAAA